MALCIFIILIITIITYFDVDTTTIRYCKEIVVVYYLLLLLGDGWSGVVMFVRVDKEDQSAQKEEKAEDLAAALFRPSRPRANSVACIAEPQKLHVKNDNRADEAQINSTVSLLLTMNYDLSEKAASEAAMVSHADVNLAQHVIFFLII